MPKFNLDRIRQIAGEINMHFINLKGMLNFPKKSFFLTLIN